MATEVRPPIETEYRASTNDRSIGELFKRLRDETTTLFRQEVQLAKVESIEKARVYGRNSAYLAAGGVIAYTGVLFVLLGLSYLLAAGLIALGLSTLTSALLSLLIVGLVVAIVGYVMIRKGLNAIKRESPVPEQTVRSLQENQQWVKHKLS